MREPWSAALAARARGATFGDASRMVENLAASIPRADTLVSVNVESQPRFVSDGGVIQELRVTTLTVVEAKIHARP